jgi:predicted GNAT family acetyltransferase
MQLHHMPMLDDPVWAALTTHQAAGSVGNELARRYPRDVNVFGAARDRSEPAQEALAGLLEPGETLHLAQAQPIMAPPGCTIVKQAVGVQMVATGPVPQTGAGPAMVPLGAADADEMLALARLTEPGPFCARTWTMGRFIGVRFDGRLAAMAGERLHLPGFTEVSGVCTHPGFRGRGLARALSAAVAAGIEARGETPFLHAWRTNTSAITLYESLGFRVRREMQVAVVARGAPTAA